MIKNRRHLRIFLFIIGISPTFLFTVEKEKLQAISRQASLYFQGNTTPSEIDQTLFLSKKLPSSLPTSPQRYALSNFAACFDYFFDPLQNRNFRVVSSPASSNPKYVSVRGNLIGLFFSPFDSTVIACSIDPLSSEDCVTYHVYYYDYIMDKIHYLSPHISSFPGASECYPSGIFEQDEEKKNHFIFFVPTGNNGEGKVCTYKNNLAFFEEEFS